MKIEIPRDDDVDRLKDTINRHDLGQSIAEWIEEHLDREATEELIGSILGHIEACRIAGIYTIDITQAIEKHDQWSKSEA
ncbi:MAG TPA: hypothetical protein HA330_04355 [Candidatus Thalassarchaeaceae archaeon]|nr:MAG TPA: hypothetical protein D7H85_04355 [Candidatus Poseidoniales archaeon]HII49103.1 hypothetical protein [Candidatus Thalassarchaeaceae archaeon]